MQYRTFFILLGVTSIFATTIFKSSKALRVNHRLYCCSNRCLPNFLYIINRTSTVGKTLCCRLWPLRIEDSFLYHTYCTTARPQFPMNRDIYNCCKEFGSGSAANNLGVRPPQVTPRSPKCNANSLHLKQRLA